MKWWCQRRNWIFYTLGSTTFASFFRKKLHNYKYLSFQNLRSIRFHFTTRGPSSSDLGPLRDTYFFQGARNTASKLNRQVVRWHGMENKKRLMFNVALESDVHDIKASSEHSVTPPFVILAERNTYYLTETA